jgi:hypothetical protein
MEMHMRKIYILAAVVLLLFCANLRADEEPSVRTEKQTVADRMRDMVLRYFNPEEGTVSDVTDRTVTVKFRDGTAVRKGMRFSVFRQDRPFYHPVTNELIGYVEDFIGRIETAGEKTEEGLYPCAIVKGDVKTGDKVRITESKIKLAFFQERNTDWDLSEAFYNSLKGSNRFEILDAYASSYDPDELSKLARGLNAEAVLLFSTAVKDDRRLMNVKMYWAEDAKQFADIEEAAGEGPVAVLSPEEKFISASLTEKEPWGSYRLPEGELFAMGDVDGNGTAELVVSDGNNISIYNFREELQEIWSIKGASGEKHLSIDVLDLNNNGKAEIFVTSLSGNTEMKTDEGRIGGTLSGTSAIRSFVLEFDPAGGYSKIKEDIPYFFRVSGRTLLMQKFGGSGVFNGPVYEGEWKDGDYRTGRQINLPPDVNIYGFTFVDWHNNGLNQIMTFDDNGYLVLYDSGGNTVWKSSRTYGKFSLSFEAGSYSIVDPEKKRFIRGRLIPLRTERGEEVIVINKVPFVAKIPGLGTKGAEVYSLWWDGREMDEKMILSDISGTVTDYWVEGKRLFLLAKGDLLSFVKNAVTGELSKGSVLYYYNFGDK